MEEECFLPGYIIDKNGRLMKKPSGRPRKDQPSQEANNYSKYFRKVNGSPPWPCHFCNGPVYPLGKGKWAVHHKDHDRSNNSSENLAAAHKTCHDQHHLKGRNITWGAKISAAKKMQWSEGVYDSIWETRKARYGFAGSRKEGAK